MEFFMCSLFHMHLVNCNSRGLLMSDYQVFINYLNMITRNLLLHEKIYIHFEHLICINI
jgi:hypothetical protein